MHWALHELDSSTREKLRSISRGGELPAGPAYFRCTNRWTWLLKLGLGGVFALGVAALVIADFIREDNSLGLMIAAVLSAMLVAWLVCIGVEMLRAALSPLRPFLLITPRALIACDHAQLTAFRLADATTFGVTTIHDRKQKQVGHRLDFTFPEGPHNVEIREGLELLAPVLEWARAGAAKLGSCGLDLFPTVPGTPRRSLGRELTDPTGNFWTWVLLLAVIAIIVAAVVHANLTPSYP